MGEGLFAVFSNCIESGFRKLKHAPPKYLRSGIANRRRKEL
jgi:hypothetical protein